MPNTFAQIKEWKCARMGKRISRNGNDDDDDDYDDEDSTNDNQPNKNLSFYILTIYKYGAEPDYAGSMWFLHKLWYVHTFFVRCECVVRNISFFLFFYCHIYSFHYKLNARKWNF